MNLVAYDKIKNVVDKTRSWIDVSSKVLFSREIKYRKYVTFGKRYNKTEEHSDLYVIMLDDTPLDRPCNKVLVDNYGRIKISLKSIWNEITIPKDVQLLSVTVKADEKADDGDIYSVSI